MSNLEQKWSGRVLWPGIVIFVLAFALRVLFLDATPDATGPFSPYYKGDTPTWLSYAQAIKASESYDFGLPLRPPGWPTWSHPFGMVNKAGFCFCG